MRLGEKELAPMEAHYEVCVFLVQLL